MKWRYVFLLIAALIGVALCITLQIVYQSMLMDNSEHLEALRDAIKEYETIPVSTETTTVMTETTEAPETTSQKEMSESSSVDTSNEVEESSFTEDTKATEENVVTPPGASLNFNRLKEINPEIHAWLEIKYTLIDYPVLQSADNDKKYLTTAYDGSPYIGGSLFTEKTYNSTDFDDPVTVIYGHTMPWGILFGQLQKVYSDSKTFETFKNIVLYLPGEVREYVVFAAVPFEKTHLLHTYDFNNAYWYDSFFDKVSRIRAIGANFALDRFPETGDRVIILSVCLEENTNKRYLVMAVLKDDLADH